MLTQTRICSLNELQPQLAKEVRAFILSGEGITMCCETKQEDNFFNKILNFVAFDARKPRWSAQVITERQLVTVAIYKSDKSAGSISLADIVSVQEHTFESEYRVSAKGPGESSILCILDPQVGPRLAHILRQAIEKSKAVHSAAGVQSPQISEERLRALTQLHKEGLVTDEEFREKRKEILEQL